MPTLTNEPHNSRTIGIVDLWWRITELRTHAAQRPLRLKMRYFELAGKRCIDLLGQSKGGELKLVNDGPMSVRPVGASEPLVTSPDHMLQLLRMGKSRRATAATDVNGGSSRSHAVLQLLVDGFDGGSAPAAEPYDEPAGAGGARYGLLTLVDCAGSERKEDSMYHTKERQKESTEINASLYALKECVRARAIALRGKRVKVPFRASNLTKVLMESLVRPEAHLAVIATVSPIPTDTEHSIATLKTVCQIAGYNDACVLEHKAEVKKNLPAREQCVPPNKWTREQFIAWLTSAHQGRFAGLVDVLPTGITGKQIARWGPAQYSALCGGPAIGAELQKQIRNEMARAEKVAKLRRGDQLGVG